MKVQPNDALLIIDPQKDFCPGGGLAVERGDEVMPIINKLAPLFAFSVITQDWHPAGHKSFASTHGVTPFSSVKLPYGDQVAWPDHCVQGTPGAEFHDGLHVLNAHAIIRKGVNPEVDSYSAFFENDHSTNTGLGGYLFQKAVRRVFIVGLALDYCVRYTAEDAIRSGFEAVVVEDACRAISPISTSEAMTSFDSLGILRVTSAELLA